MPFLNQQLACGFKLNLYTGIYFYKSPIGMAVGVIDAKSSIRGQDVY